jgi:hypothetical protein
MVESIPEEPRSEYVATSGQKSDEFILKLIDHQIYKSNLDAESALSTIKKDSEEVVESPGDPEDLVEEDKYHITES